MLRWLLAGAAGIVVLLPMAASGSPIQPQLNARVSSRSIALTDAQGKRVRTLSQRSYRIVVRDSSTGQNFHLAGPRIDLKTKVSTTGTRVWSVGFGTGTYVYRSDSNPKLHGSFTVLSSPPPA